MKTVYAFIRLNEIGISDSNIERCYVVEISGKNIGCSLSEMENLDFETIGRNLFISGSGKVTPYGVVFCNQLPVQEMYDGKIFPDYDYTSDYVLKLEVMRKDFPLTSPEKVWLYLPTSDTCITKAMLPLNADTYNVDCQHFFRQLF